MPETLGQPTIGLPGENVPQPLSVEQPEQSVETVEQPVSQPETDLDTQALITQLEEDKTRAEALPSEIQESFKDAPLGLVDPLGLGAGAETERAEILAIDANTAGAKIELIKNYEVAQAQIKDAESKAGDTAYQVNQEQIDFAKENLGKLREYLKVINNPKWTPFIQYNGSNFVIPIDKFEMVEKLGITDKELITLGYDQNELDKMREKRKVLDILKKYDNLSDAVRDGKIDVVRQANELGLITDEQLVESQIQTGSVGLLKEFVNDIGQLKLKEAVQAGVEYNTILQAGYNITEDDYNSFVISNKGGKVGGYEVALDEIPTANPYSSMLELNNAYKLAEDKLTALIVAVDSNKSLSKEERDNIINKSDEYKTYLQLKADIVNPNIIQTSGQSAFSDDLAEILSMGQVQTATYNNDELEKQYDNQINISTAVFNGDKGELQNLFAQGAFGDINNEKSKIAYFDTLKVVDQQYAIEQAVKSGNTGNLETLRRNGAFDGNEALYNNLIEYVNSGGRDIAPPTPEELAVVKESYGTREEYVKNIIDSQPTNIELAKGIGTAMIPVYGTIKTWDSMNGAWRGISIGLDVLTFVPLIGGIAAAAKVSAGVGRSARLIAGLKAIPAIFTSEIKAPFTALAHPLNTVKSTASEITNMGEWLLNPRKIPLNSATTTYGTIRLDVNVVGSPEGAMYVRDELMRLASIGEDPVVIFAGKEYRLREPILMKEGGLVTASPDIKWVGTEGGAVVTTKIYPEGHPKGGQRVIDREQGLFVSNAPLERFTSSSAFGLEKIGVGTLDDKLALLTEKANEARVSGNLKLADKLDNIISSVEDAKLSQDVNKIDKANANIVKQVDELTINETLEAIYQAKINANERMKIGDIAGAKEAMDEALALENILKPKVPGVAVFSPDVAVYAVPSEKLYPGMIFKPNADEVWSILSSQVREDKAAQLLIKADNAKKVGDLKLANQLSTEAKEIISSGTSGFKRVNTAEMELKFPELFKLPEMNQTYFTRSGRQKLAIFTDKPYSPSTVVKAKLLAPIETVKQIYTPAVSAKTIPMTDLDKLAQAEKLLKEATELDKLGDITSAKLKRLEALTLKNSVSNVTTIEQAVKTSTAIDDVNEYTQAAQKAESLGDIVESDRLIREAESIRSERISNKEYTNSVTGRAGTVMGVFGDVRVLGYRPDGYEKVQDVRVDNGRTTQTREVEARIPDSREPNARSTETRLQDNRVPEARIPESRITDTRVIETRIPEVRSPDVRVPEVRIPDTRIPDVRIPEVRVPDVRVPDTRIPEVRPPETRPPEVRPPETRIPDARIEFEEDESKNKKLENGFITWRQGKTYWAIPQKEDGTFDSNDKVSSGKPFRGTTKFATGKGSTYKTMQYVGNNPPEKADIDIGFAQFTLVRDGNDVKLTRIYPDERANWDGTNRFTREGGVDGVETEEEVDADARIEELLDEIEDIEASAGGEGGEPPVEPPPTAVGGEEPEESDGEKEPEEPKDDVSEDRLTKLEYGDKVVDLGIKGDYPSYQDLREAKMELEDGLYIAGDDYVYEVIDHKIKVLPQYRSRFNYGSGKYIYTERPLISEDIREVPIFHGSTAENMTLDKLDIKMSGQNYGGVGGNEFDALYFTTRPSDAKGWATLHRGSKGSIIEARISPDAKVIKYDEMGRRNQQELMEQGIDVVLKYPKGGDYGEVIILNPKVLVNPPPVTVRGKESERPFRKLTDMPYYDAFIKDSEYAKKKGFEAKIVEMSPDEYILKTAEMQGSSIDKQLDMVDPERLDEYAEMMKNGTKFDLPMLDYSRGEQEGRARALAAKKLGYEKIPVLEVRKIQEPAEITNKIRTDLLPEDVKIKVKPDLRLDAQHSWDTESDKPVIYAKTQEIANDPVIMNHEIAHELIQKYQRKDVYEGFLKDYKQALGYPPDANMGEWSEDLAYKLGDYINGGKADSQKLDVFYNKYFPEVREQSEELLQMTNKGLKKDYYEKLEPDMQEFVMEIAKTAETNMPVTGEPYKRTLWRGVKKSGIPTDEGMYGKGTYYSTDPSYAKNYVGEDGGTLLEHTIELKNPYVAHGGEIQQLGRESFQKAIKDGKGYKVAEEESARAIRSSLESQGYDGIVMPITNPNTGLTHSEVVVFNPEKAVVGADIGIKGEELNGGKRESRRGSPITDSLDLTYSGESPQGAELWFDIIRDAKVVGKVKIVDKDESIYVNDIVIDPEYRRQGLALSSLNEVSELLGKPIDKSSVLTAAGKALQESLTGEERDELVDEVISEIEEVEEEEPEKKVSSREERIAKYKRQYSKLPKKKERRNVFPEVDKVLKKEDEDLPEYEDNKVRYMGLEIIPPQIGGDL